MPNIFINADDEMEITLAVGSAKDDPRQIVADQGVEQLKEVYGDGIDPDSIEEHKVWFRVPTFGDQTKIIDSSVSIADDQFHINPQSLRSRRITQLVKRWTFKGADGKATFPNEEMVKKMHPVIASMIGVQLELEMQKRGLF